MNVNFDIKGLQQLGAIPAVRAINYRFGFIGVGNMGGALAQAASRSTKQIILCDHDAQKAADLGRRIGCEFADSRTVVAESEYVFLGVKPQMMAEMLEEIKKTLKQHRDVILVSMAAGLSIKTLRKMAGGSYKVIRIMPNLAVEVGKGEILCWPGRWIWTRAARYRAAVPPSSTSLSAVSPRAASKRVLTPRPL